MRDYKLLPCMLTINAHTAHTQLGHVLHFFGNDCVRLPVSHDVNFSGQYDKTLIHCWYQSKSRYNKLWRSEIRITNDQKI